MPKPLLSSVSPACTPQMASPYPEFATVRDLDSFKNMILQAVTQLGLTDYWFLPLHQTGKDMGQVASLPAAFFAAYREARLHHHDLLLTYANEHHPRPVYYSTLHDYLQQAPVECGWIRGMREISALHAAYGFYDYYCVFVRGEGSGGRGMLAVTHSNLTGPDFRERMQGKEARVQVLAGVIGAVGRQTFPGVFLGRQAVLPVITPQPLKVLAALANNDMTITQLADKLCLSPVTAHRHITAARKALGARTNVGAIKKAMQLGLIEYTE